MPLLSGDFSLHTLVPALSSPYALGMASTASPALRRLAMEAKKPRHCEGVRVLGPCSESTPLKYSVEIVGP